MSAPAAAPPADGRDRPLLRRARPRPPSRRRPAGCYGAATMRRHPILHLVLTAFTAAAAAACDDGAAASSSGETGAGGNLSAASGSGDPASTDAASGAGG